MDKRVVEIGSQEFYDLKPEDFDPEVVRKIYNLLFRPGYQQAYSQDSAEVKAQS